MAPAAKKLRMKSRNPELVPGIGKFSRSKMYHKRGVWAIKAKHAGSLPRRHLQVLPRRRRQEAPRQPPQAQTHKAQGEHYAWNGVDSVGGKVYGEEGRFPQAVAFWVASSHRFFTNTLILPEINGPTEGPMLIYLCHFFTAFVGAEWWVQDFRLSFPFLGWVPWIPVNKCKHPSTMKAKGNRRCLVVMATNF